MLDASLVGDNPFSCVLKALLWECVSSHVVLMASQSSVEAVSVCVSHGRERRTRDNPTTRHKGQENHSCAPVSAHTHSLSEPSALPFTVSDKFRCFSSAQQHHYIHCLVKWKKEGFVGEFPPRLRPLWFSFINMLICELRCDEWWRVGKIDCAGISHFSVCNWLGFVSFEIWYLMYSILCHPPASFEEKSCLD